MILDDPVGLTALDQVVGRVAAGGVHEAADDLVVAVQLGDGAQAVLIEEALAQDAVDFLADAAVTTVDRVVDRLAVGQDDLV